MVSPEKPVVLLIALSHPGLCQQVSTDLISTLQSSTTLIQTPDVAAALSHMSNSGLKAVILADGDLTRTSSDRAPPLLATIAGFRQERRDRSLRCLLQLLRQPCRAHQLLQQDLVATLEERELPTDRFLPRRRGNTWLGCEGTSENVLAESVGVEGCCCFGQGLRSDARVHVAELGLGPGSRLESRTRRRWRLRRLERGCLGMSVMSTRRRALQRW